MGPRIVPFFIVPPHATLGITSLLASLSLRTGPLCRGGNEALRSGRAEARKANTPVRHCLILTEGLLEREIRHELSGAEGGCCEPLSGYITLRLLRNLYRFVGLRQADPRAQETNCECVGQAEPHQSKSSVTGVYWPAQWNPGVGWLEQTQLAFILLPHSLLFSYLSCRWNASSLVATLWLCLDQCENKSRYPKEGWAEIWITSFNLGTGAAYS